MGLPLWQALFLCFKDFLTSFVVFLCKMIDFFVLTYKFINFAVRIIGQWAN